MALSKIVENSITDGVVSAAKLKDFSAAVDLNGVELILDADQDTSITADTDDRIDFKIAGVEHFSFSNSSGDTVIKPMVDAKDIKLQQFDGRTLLDINDGGFIGVGNGATGPGVIRILEDTDNGSNYVGLSVGNVSTAYTLVFPNADGSSGQALTTNGSGVLSFSTVSANTPSSADGQALGSASLEWSDLFLADASTIQFGADQDVTLTHVADTGLLLNGASVIQLRDSAINIGSPADGDLDINADDEIELNSTLIDINGNVEISGTAVTTGVHTFTAVPVFPNNTIETADIQADAIDGTKIADDAINSEHYTDGSIDTAHLADGQVTIGKLATAVLTGATDIGAAIVDADLFLVDDGAGGTLRKTTAARIKTYAATSGAVTGITSVLNTSLVLGRDADNDIDFTADNIITFRAAAVDQVKLIDNAFSPVADSDVDLGTNSLRFKDAYIDTITTTGTITASGIVTGTGFTAGNAVLAEAELELLDGLTAGTAIASKVVTTDASIDTSGQRNLTISGELDAATLDISGDVDIAGASRLGTLGVVTAKDLGTGIHIRTADSGGTVSADADELVIEGSGTSGMTILTANNVMGRIFFGDADAAAPGYIRYNHANDVMDFGAGDNTIFSMTSGTVVVNEDSDDVDFRVESNGNANMLFVSGGNDVVGIGAEGDLGVGLHIRSSDTGGTAENHADELVLENDNNCGITILSGNDDAGIINFGDDGDNNIGMISYTHDGNYMRIKTNNAERIRFLSDGNIAIGTTSASQSAKVTIESGANVPVMNVESTNGSQTNKVFKVYCARNTTNGTYDLANFDGTSETKMLIRDSGNVNNINNSYGAISDERIKQNITDASSQWDDIKAIKVRNFKLKSDTTKTQLGVIAQELEASGMNGLVGEGNPQVLDIVADSSFGTLENDTERPIKYVDGDSLPEGISIGDNKLDSDGNIQYHKKVKTIDAKVKEVKYSVLYMKAIKALQESMTRIETLESKVKTLEAKTNISLEDE